MEGIWKAYVICCTYFPVDQLDAVLQEQKEGTRKLWPQTADETAADLSRQHAGIEQQRGTLQRYFHDVNSTVPRTENLL